MMKLGRMTAIAAAIVVSLAGGAAAQELTLRIGHVDAQTSHSGVGADAFAAAVGRLSDHLPFGLLFQNLPETLAHDRVIVPQHNP